MKRSPSSVPPLGIGITVHRRYSDLLFVGKKKIEIRRAKPARTVRCAFVYEPAPISAVRGTLVLGSIEQVDQLTLRERLGETEWQQAAQYLAGRAGAFCLLNVKVAVEYERLDASERIRDRLRGIQSFTYIERSEPAAHDLIWLHLSGVSVNERRVLSLNAPSEVVDEGKEDASLIREVSMFYGELDRGFQLTHIPKIGTARSSIGFSSFAKRSYAIHRSGSWVGKLVVTIKRAHTLKIAPVYISRESRGNGLATQAVRLITRRARELGVRQVFTTIPRSNAAARRAFEKAGFSHVATLTSHYESAADEDVYVAWADVDPSVWYVPPSITLTGLSGKTLLTAHVERYFFPVDEQWRDWMQTTTITLDDFEEKPHEAIGTADQRAMALLVYKRGGTVKVVPTAHDQVLPVSLVDTWEHRARVQNRRKVSVFLPASWPHQSALHAYKLELMAATYSLYEPIYIYSKELSTSL